MATTEERLGAAHRALKRASQRIAAQQKEIQALTNRISAAEKQVEKLYREVGGFGDLVKEQSRSIQKAAQGNYRELDQRISKLERRKTQEQITAEAEAAEAIADLPMSER